MVRITRLVGKIMNAVSIILMIALCIPIAYEAIARSFGAPTTWVFEITLYAFIFLGFLGNTLAVQSGAHFRVTVMRDLFPKKKKLFDLIAQLATLLLAALIVSSGTYFVWYTATNTIVSATLLEVPLWMPALAIPLGGLGLLLQTLAHLITGEVPDEAHTVIGD